jgi:ribose transport system permease protein
MKNIFKSSVSIAIGAFIVLLIVFSIGSNMALFSPNNIALLLEQAIIVIIGGLGIIFVISIGSLDLSIGSIMGLSAMIGSIAAIALTSWMLVPVTILVGLGFGVFNGVIVSKFKVSSFMATLALLIGLKGVTNYLMGDEVRFLPSDLLVINSYPVKVTLLLVLVILIWYVFEYTKLGRYCKAIGENETVARFVGIPVDRIKIIAYIISGLIASICAILSVVRIGGPAHSLGYFFEMRVMMAIFLGGVPIEGGMRTKVYKMIIGAFTIVLIENGLILCHASSEISEAVEGIFLIVILFFTSYKSDSNEEKSPKRSLPSFREKLRPNLK